MPDLFLGADDARQYLLTVYDDGTVTIATRERTDDHTQPSIGWGPPVDLIEQISWVKQLAPDPWLHPEQET